MLIPYTWLHSSREREDDRGQGGSQKKRRDIPQVLHEIANGTGNFFVFVERERYDGLHRWWFALVFLLYYSSWQYPLLQLLFSPLIAKKRAEQVEETSTHTTKQIVIHSHVEMQCADQFPPIYSISIACTSTLSLLLVSNPHPPPLPRPSLSLSSSVSLSFSLFPLPRNFPLSLSVSAA